MKKSPFITAGILGLLACTAPLLAQDTFSIVAVDQATGEVGSAGATCLDSASNGTSALIISEVKPGVGAIHTQSFWDPTNQANASARMDAGDSPEEIMLWLEANDAAGTPEVRQYGAVDFDPVSGAPRVAAFTGADCFDEKDHELGPNYAIQGNILINRDVLDSMAINFFFADGDLADKLMAALQGANRPGADSRCLSEGVSSRSAFIRVAKPNDHPDSLFLDLVVGQTPFGVEPIDVLQDKFDNWRDDNPTPPPPSGLDDGIGFAEGTWKATVRPHPAGPRAVLDLDQAPTGTVIRILDQTGRLLHKATWEGRALNLGAWNLPAGTHWLQLWFDGQERGVQPMVYHP